MRRTGIILAVLAVIAALPLEAQVPQPFPGRIPPTKPAPVPPETARPAAPSTPVAAPESETAPSEMTLGVPIYPAAQFIASYDAGRGQRYYLFGSEAAFSVLVKYYQSVLKTKGTLVFDTPATHVFEVGRFREETMAFPPGVTIKDYTWNGSLGYMNPQKDGKPARFPSIIQIVPLPAGAPR
jgi:hypothetical protein